MSTKELQRLFAEAAELGVSAMLIGGGEPLSRSDILDITESFPQILFGLFTNGLLMDEQTIARLRSQRHVIPVISIEGLETDTDHRRGIGVHDQVRGTMEMLNRGRVFYGTSLTVTRKNFATATDKIFIRNLISIGCKLLFFIDYVPVQEGTEDLVLTDGQIAAKARILDSFRKRLPAVFVAFPGDEISVGGCLAAGRGFVHVSPQGRLEPCPFSPFSDVSLKETSLRDALKSRLLRTIRENRELLSEEGGGCGLWNNREWVASLVAPMEDVSGGQ
jgi:MoaA/NifB/PqqE/SkfB family radical SAM enzyme